MAKVRYKALKCKQNGRCFYVAVMNSADLKVMCAVTRKKEDPLKGFQRLLNEKRADEIASYLDNRDGVIPSAPILSAQPKAKIKYTDSINEISMEKVAEALLILDGQHRLFGLYRAEKSYDIPVIIFENLNSQDEVRQFIDINTKQKGVSTALILDIKGQAGTETKIEERQRALFDAMNNDSVLAGLLLPNESKTGKISRTTFYQATRQIYISGPLSNSTDEVITKAFRNYLKAVDSVLKESGEPGAKLTKNVLFKAFVDVFNEICDKCLSKYNNLKADTIREYISPLKNLKYEYAGTNKVTQGNIASDIRSELREDKEFDEDMF